MARFIRPDGTELEVLPWAGAAKFGETNVKAWIGDVAGFFVLAPQLLMVANVAAIAYGARRNPKAIQMIRISVFEPLAEVYGPVLVMHPDEIDFREFFNEDISYRLRSKRTPQPQKWKR